MFADQQWVREMFVGLLEGEFDVDKVHEWVMIEAYRYSRSHFSSLLIENFGKTCKSFTDQHQNHACSASTFMHTLALGSTVNADHGRPLPVVTTTARNAAS